MAAPGEQPVQLGQGDLHPSPRLSEAHQLGGQEVLRAGDDDAPGDPVDLPLAAVGNNAFQVLHGLVLLVGHGQQVAMLAGDQRAHKPNGGNVHGSEVGLGVVALVEHHGHGGGVHPDSLQAGHKLGECRREDLGVGSVAGRGDVAQGDAVIRRAGQGQSHEAQVEALVLGVAPLGDVRAAVGGGDEGVEVGRVVDQGLGVDAELIHRRLDVGLLDCLHQ